MTDQSPAHDVALRLRDLCLAVAADLAMAGAAVSLRSPSGDEALAAVSGRSAGLWAGIEFDLGEGPARQSLERGRPVLVSDLEGGEAQDWPAWAAAAMAAGVCAVFAVPLQVGATQFGVLTLFASQPRRLDRTARAHLYSVAEVATSILLDAAGPGSGRGDLDTNLAGALVFRSEVYQAQGMTMEALGVDLPEALARLRAHAWMTGRDLDAVALDIVHGRLVLEADPPHRPPGDTGVSDHAEDPPS